MDEMLTERVGCADEACAVLCGQAGHGELAVAGASGGRRRGHSRAMVVVDGARKRRCWETRRRAMALIPAGLGQRYILQRPSGRARPSASAIIAIA